MAGFADVLSEADAGAIHAYVIDRARDAWRAAHARNE
jgi:mono/diheme cytochrome c family protein